MSPNKTLENLKILLVEDEAFVRKVNSHVLAGLTGQKILEADSARNAIGILNKQSVDLVITDIQMPEMNGLELMKEVRCGRTKAPAELPMLVITSYSNTEVLGSSMGLDVNGFLVKPISSKNAMEKINIAIRERVKLRNVMVYERVITNLDSLSDGASPVKPEPKQVNASITISPVGKEESALAIEGVKVPITQLKPGMTLVSALHSRDGVILLTSGQLLNEQLINRVKELQKLVDDKELLVLLPEDPAA